MDKIRENRQMFRARYESGTGSGKNAVMEMNVDGKKKRPKIGYE